MRNIAKKRKQRFSYLPISIKLVIKILLLVVGFSVWGTGFICVVVGVYLFFPILRVLFSLFVGFAAILLFLFFLLTFL